MSETSELLPISCPFCHDDDYDAVGLKMHLQNGHCEAFEAVDATGRLSAIRGPFRRSSPGIGESEVSEEAVEAALRAFDADKVQSDELAMKDALTAARPYLHPPAATAQTELALNEKLKRALETADSQQRVAIKAMERVKELQTFLEFVARWAWDKEDLSPTERLECIQFYPPIKALAALKQGSAE